MMVIVMIVIIITMIRANSTIMIKTIVRENSKPFKNHKNSLFFHGTYSTRTTDITHSTRTTDITHGTQHPRYVQHTDNRHTHGTHLILADGLHQC